MIYKYTSPNKNNLWTNKSVVVFIANQSLNIKYSEISCFKKMVLIADQSLNI